MPVRLHHGAKDFMVGSLMKPQRPIWTTCADQFRNSEEGIAPLYFVKKKLQSFQHGLAVNDEVFGGHTVAEAFFMESVMEEYD